MLVNGAPGLLYDADGEPAAVLGFTIAGGRIAEIDVIADPAKLRHLTIRP